MTRGESMRAARIKAGFTQGALADEAGIMRNTLGRIERDEHIGRIDTIELLADVLGISIDEYVGHEVKVNG